MALRIGPCSRRAAEAPPPAEAAIPLCKRHRLQPDSKQEKLLRAAPNSHLLSSSGLQSDSQLHSGAQTPCRRVFPGGMGCHWRTALVPTTSFTGGCCGVTDTSQYQSPAAHNALASILPTPRHPGLTWYRVPPPSVEASFSSCVPGVKPSSPSSTLRALRAGPRGLWACPCSKCAARAHVATACTWPVSPSVTCLEQEDITGNELFSWAEAADNELCTLLPLGCLLPSRFFLSFWVMGMKLHEVGQTEGMHRAPTPQGFAPALQASSPGRAGPAQPGRSHHTKSWLSTSHQLQQ